MARPRPSPALREPTEVELEILRVLWRLGRPSTVRQVHRELVAQHAHRRNTGYSTTLKMMQVMRDKGLLSRDDSVRPQLYRPAATQDRTQLQLLDSLVQKVFGGSAARLLVRAISARRVSSEELAELEQLIQQARRKEAAK